MASEPDDADRTLSPAPDSSPTPTPVSPPTPSRATPWLDPSHVHLGGGERYQVRELLGRGGVGEVWLVDDREIEREVAVKRLRRTVPTEGEVRRFVREAKLQGQIEHPAVVPVHDLARSPDGHPYFVMRRVRGQTLKEIVQLLTAGRPEDLSRYSRRRLLTAFSSICRAVHYAHTRGVIHRDLKPENVMLGDFGEVYLLDWGLAKRLHLGEPVEENDSAEWSGEIEANLTEVGKVMGTPSYMAPEQIQNRRAELGPPTDVYALGVILYELLRGERRYGNLAVSDIFAATLRGVWEPPSVLRSDEPPELDAVCQRAMALSPGERYATAGELAEAVDRFLDGDRDLAQRRALATAHAANAQAALSRSRAGEGDAAAHRLEAVQQVVQAIALDPEQQVAREALVRLMVEMPDKLPPEAEQAIAASAQHGRVAAVRLGVAIYLSWLACAAYALVMGVKSWPPVLFTSGAVLATAAAAFFIARSGKVSQAACVGLAALTLVSVAAFGCWLGPFVLVPVAAASTTLIFCSQAEPVERWVILGMGVVACLLPYLLDWSGLVPPGYVFEAGRLVLPARAVEITPHLTLAGLVYTSVAFTFFPAYAIGRVRDSLVSAERKLFLHAWHFDQLTRAFGRPR